MRTSRRQTLQWLCVSGAGLCLWAQPKRPPRAEWVQLRGYNYRTGRINADARSLDNAEVRIIGYMVPFDDEQNKATEFLLVPQFGQCIHVPPPPPNQIVLVTMKDGKAAPIAWDRPVMVTGRMHLGEAKSPYGRALYRMTATLVDPNVDV
ncbi:MAG: DUF3299 domain-containing protein [Bryobacterales bacterium]|nr:DUF3299 domain-containing protein [Bryobacterales bacterium]